MEAFETEVFPIFLRLEGRTVLVVGGGEIATRKVTDLLVAKARVKVVTKEASETITALVAEGKIELALRAFEPTDVDGAWFIISATNDSAVNGEVSKMAEARRIFICSVDDPEHASAYFGGIVRRPPFLISISSSGALPAMTRLLRQVIESVIPEDALIDDARELRASWKKNNVPMGARFPELVKLIAARAEKETPR